MWGVVVVWLVGVPGVVSGLVGVPCLVGVLVEGGAGAREGVVQGGVGQRKLLNKKYMQMD